ncbi:MAG: hypothetical protein ACSLFR_00020 [Solirubrobacteraceae bacterium]
MNDLQRIRPGTAAAVVLTVAATAFAGLTVSGLADSLHTTDQPADAPQPAQLPNVPDSVTAPEDRPQTVQTVKAPNTATIPNPTTVRHKTCRLPGGRAMSVRKGTPCPTMPQIDQDVAERLQRRPAQQPAAPQQPQTSPSPAQPQQGAETKPQHGGAAPDLSPGAAPDPSPGGAAAPPG